MGNARRCLGAVLVLLVGLWSLGARAQPIDDRLIPPELVPWKGWVLDNVDLCPAIDGSSVCLWPGELRIEVAARGGEFEYVVFADRPTLAVLPGSADYWPQDVKLGAQPAVVSGENDLPAVQVTAGRHVITGRFPWATPPDSLTIPAECARVRVAADGKAIPFPRREATTLWLQGIEVEAPEAAAEPTPAEAVPDSLDISVTRRLVDGTPFLVTTRLELRAAGKPREVTVGKVLLGESELLGVESPGIPVRVDDGVLVAQVRTGTFIIQVYSVFATPPKELTVRKLPDPWPSQETWAWQPDEALRQVALSGASAVDPRQTTLPAEWRAGSAFQLEPGLKLTFTTKRRGQTEPPPNDVQLERTMWLALDGSQWTVQDHFTGQMHRTFRLDLAAGELGRVSARDQDFLLTYHPGDKTPGVEVRQGALDLMAEWVLPGRTRIPAVGWSEDVKSLRLTLRTPPGWRVLNARGVDDFDGAPLASVELVTLLLIGLIAFGIGKLGKPWWGLVAAPGLFLASQSMGLSLTSWAFAVGALVGLRYLAWAWARPVLWAVALIATLRLGASLADHVAEVTATALFPAAAAQREAQMEEVAEQSADNKEGGTGTRAKGEEGSMGSPSADRRYAVAAPTNYGGAKAPRAAEQEEEAQAPKRPPKDVVLQMGPGVPAYPGRDWSLIIEGPVKRDHVIELTLLTPFQNALLGLLEAGLLVGLLALFLRLFWRVPSSSAKPGAGAVTAAAALGFALLVMPRVAHAEIPNDAVLEELRTRLSRTPDCTACVSVSRLRLELTGPTIAVESEVHVTGTQGYRLPGSPDTWLPDVITVDGKAADAVVLRGDAAYVRLGPGRHLVRAQGDVAKASLTFSLGTPPRRVDIVTKDWTAEGLGANGVPGGALELSRQAVPVAAGAPEPAESPPSAAPATGVDEGWLLVERTLDIGVKWTVKTVVTRVEPSKAPITVEYPLLKGERVVTAGVVTREGTMRLTLAQGEKSLTINSSLTIAPELALTAVTTRRVTETWKLECNEMWRCGFAGLTPKTLGAGFKPEFAPWPGEKLALTFTRPEATPGSSLTIDSARLVVTPGPRAMLGKLSVALRASKAQPLTATLPEGAEVTSVQVDFTERAIDKAGNDLTLNLEPGGHAVEVAWKQPAKLGVFFRVPEVKLSARAANAEVRVDGLESDRAILWLSGPYWGPHIVEWVPWLLLVGVALVLGTLRKSPLPVWQWAVLGFGFIGSGGWLALAVVVFWFFLVQARGEASPLSPRLHGARQLGLGLATLVALLVLLGQGYVRLTTVPRFLAQGGYTQGYGTVLNWYRDAMDGAFARPLVVSVPEWVVQAVYVVWVGVVAYLCWRWAKWAVAQYGAGGLWLPLQPLAAAEGGAAAAVAASAPEASEGTAPAPVAPLADNEPSERAEGDEETQGDR